MVGARNRLQRFDDEYSQNGRLSLAGVDEAGRGSLAGPVVAAAVVLPGGWCPGRLDDSKRLRPAVREELFARIRERANSWAAVAVSPATIDSHNILVATLLAMSRAVHKLRPGPDLVLVDGNQLPRLALPTRAIVKGDGRSAAVAAASVVAKVLRDRIMTVWDRRHPGYGFASNKGYGSQSHRDALKLLGPCPLHRFSFGPVAALRQGRLWPESR